jgi:AraC-like DNA-binding protein/ligand-binding sensor protein
MLGFFRTSLTLAMNQSLFETLARSRIVRRYEEAFRVATGFVMKLQPPTAVGEPSPFGLHANPFCTLMSTRPESKAVCKKTFAKVRDEAADKLAPAQSCCFAGFAHIAIPVISAGEHIATVYGGQLMLEKPNKQAYDKIERQLIRLGLGDYLAELEHAWFNTPVVSEKQLEAIIYLLETFAARISKYAATKVLEAVDGEPAVVTRARRFIQERFAEPFTMPDAARYVQMSPSSFSKLFKKALGLTFTQYLTRFRVEKSKSMLVNPAESIRQIAFQSGFDSISQFNRSFRQYAEMSPTEYRASLADGDPAVSAQRVKSLASPHPHVKRGMERVG